MHESKIFSIRMSKLTKRGLSVLAALSGLSHGQLLSFFVKKSFESEGDFLDDLLTNPQKKAELEAFRASFTDE